MEQKKLQSYCFENCEFSNHYISMQPEKKIFAL